MRQNVMTKVFFLWITVLLSLFTACNEVDTPVVTIPDKPDAGNEEFPAEWKVLKEFTFDDLRALGKKAGFSWVTLLTGDKPFFEGDVQLRVLKVTYLSANPNGTKEKIKLSGVLLLPPAIDSATVHRQVLAPPYTYVLDRQAPTRQFTANDFFKPEVYMIFWMLQAARGYVVMIPDYPGFGDSFGKCFIPYIDKKAMTRTTIDFVKASQSVLRENHYAKKNDLVMAGYSLGAFVATQVARELETNPTEEFSVSFLFAGGTPCDIKKISDMTKASETLPEPYLLPLAICGYKQNAYPDLNVASLLKEPYASDVSLYFDGKSDRYRTFPSKTHDLFTPSFINDTDESLAPIHAIMKANSLKPWKNKCEFVLIHGKEDITVHYDNAKMYADAHNLAGGKVKFIEVSGDHVRAGIPYFVYLMSYLPKYK